MTLFELNGCCWIVIADLVADFVVNFVANFVANLCCFVAKQFLVTNMRYAFGQQHNLK